MPVAKLKLSGLFLSTLLLSEPIHSVQNFNCGTPSSSLIFGPGIINEKLIIPWNAPILRRLGVGPDKAFSAVLVAPSLVLFSVSLLEEDGVHNDIDYKYKPRIYNMSCYLALPGSPEMVYPSSSTYKQIHLTHFRFHPEILIGTWQKRQNHFVLGHLEEEIDPEVANPICMPNPDDLPDFDAYLENLRTPTNSESLVLTGWNRNNVLVNDMLRMKILERKECLEFWNSQEDSKDYPYGNHWCAEVGIENTHFQCVHRTVGAVTEINGSFHFVGWTNEFYGVGSDVLCLPGSMYFFQKLDRRTYNWIWDNIRCGPQQFTCSEGSCVELSSICNRTAECPDQSDEDEEYCKALNYCPEDQFRCSKYGPCIDRDKVQNGIPDCPFGEDEEGYSHFKKYVVPITICVTSSILLTFVIYVTLSRMKMRKLKNEVRQLSKNEELAFRQGNYVLKNIYSHNDGTENSGTSNSSIDNEKPMLLDEHFASLPWKHEWEIPLDFIKLHQEISRGNFGVVYDGSLTLPSGELIPVAVKTPKEGVTAKEFIQMFLRELKMLAYLGDNANVYKFYGASTQSLKNCEVYIVTEFCENGNLQQFLKKHGDSFVNLENPLEVRRLSAISSDYQFTRYQYGNLDTYNLMQWSIQTAAGMEYLTNRHVVHGDLAARNILLDKNLEVKISDFGLSRVFGCSGVYKKNPKDPGPWKWMAPEAIRDNALSEKSDVWSFGILLWETFSLGGTPYWDVKYGKGFIKSLYSGVQLAQPLFASCELYKLMQTTWSINPGNRPNFSKMKDQLSLLLDKLEVEVHCRITSSDSGRSSLDGISGEDVPI